MCVGLHACMCVCVLCVCACVRVHVCVKYRAGSSAGGICQPTRGDGSAIHALVPVRQCHHNLWSHVLKMRRLEATPDEFVVFAAWLSSGLCSLGSVSIDDGHTFVP